MCLLVSARARMLCSPDFVHAPSRFTMLRCGPRCVMIFSSDIRACFSLERAVAEREKRNSDYRSTTTTSDGSPPHLQLICTFPSLLCFSIAASTCKNCKQMYLPPVFFQFSTVNSRNVWLLVNPLCRAKTNVLWLSDGSYCKVRFRSGARFPTIDLQTAHPNGSAPSGHASSGQGQLSQSGNITNLPLTLVSMEVLVTFSYP